MATIHEIHQKIISEIQKVVLGQDHLVDLAIAAILCQGHVLLEGVPGTGKTLLVRTLAHILGIDFNRIQFTPDLMPSDILGTNIFNFQKNEFILTRGPVFTQFLMADEINRTPPKTQAALLEAMQERNVTIDGQTHHLSHVFMVAATQNPIEQEGTYPLPEAQLDRFLFKLNVEPMSHEQEFNMVKKHQKGIIMNDPQKLGVNKILNEETLKSMREHVASRDVNESMIDYIVKIVRKTREHPLVLAGGSPRSVLMLTNAARAYATIRNRDYVIPDDIKELIEPCLGHRIILTPNAQIEGISTKKILDDIMSEIPVPR